MLFSSEIKPFALAIIVIVPIFTSFKGRRMTKAWSQYVLQTELLKLSMSVGQAFPEPTISATPETVNNY